MATEFRSKIHIETAREAAAAYNSSMELGSDRLFDSAQSEAFLLEVQELFPLAEIAKVA